MSEPAAEAPGRAGPGSSASGLGILGRKVGGFPVWVYAAVLAGLLGWRYVASKKSASSTTSGTSGATTDTSTPADQVPQFVNQTYTTVSPPSAPQPTTTVPTMPGGGNPGGPVVPPPTGPKAPGQVKGLHETGVGATNVQLAWNPVSGAQQYQVRVTYQNKVIKTYMTNGTSFKVPSLKPNRTYGLHVVAINGNQWAPEASITQKTAA